MLYAWAMNMIANAWYIYGQRGIKAGFTQGLCKEQLLLAAEHLCELGAGVLILGYTELPWCSTIARRLKSMGTPWLLSTRRRSWL
jgi:hypothetical protein